jgi:hypothetical protein
MAQGVARYLQRASRAFSGHVILVTSPPGVERCSTVTHPGPRPEPAPYNPITDEPTMMVRGAIVALVCLGHGRRVQGRCVLVCVACAFLAGTGVLLQTG